MVAKAVIDILVLPGLLEIVLLIIISILLLLAGDAVYDRRDHINSNLMEE